ncbi:MAG: 30S ribosomal protein S12 methylthiotransferase RimO [Lachnospiraceae bacterium]|nr:30S ribosomal protein S12 methylthiotransferase RimO [Lachnospiraceae bacterium]
MQVFFESLGCDKNLVDSEVMLGLLRDAGYQLTDDDREADVIVVNTCCFIGDAKEESIRTILDLAQRKEDARCRAIVATGCLAERYQGEILTEIPELDAVLGTSSYDRLPEILDELLEAEPETHRRVFEPVDRLIETNTRRVLTTGGHYAYLKIAEGCDKHCSYCVIPSVRGRFRSYPMERLLEEARQLAEGGAAELILVAQETTLYGTDLYGRKMLGELLRQLAAIPEVRWLRVLYAYPEEIDGDLIRVMAEEPKVCHYLDMPVQSASDAVLRRMGRRTTAAELEKTVERLRSAVPDICLRTTLISGFPGETDEDHAQTLDFLRRMRFDRLGVFPYSREEGTPAAKMKDQIPKRIKMKRRGELMREQQRIAFEKAEEMIGRRLTVMVEGQVPEEGICVTRTYMDAPDVDGYLFLEEDRQRLSGSFVPVTVTGAKGYDLIGRAEDEFAE